MMRAPHRFARFETGRLEAFTDGVIAVIITITVLDIKAPHGVSLRDLGATGPVFAAYAISFVYVAIYWNNHHHLMRAAKAIDARVMWANLHLLFWLSLVPFATSWVGENFDAATPTALYAAILFMAAIAYTILLFCIIAVNGRDSAIARQTRSDFKGRISLAIYAIAIGAAFFSTRVADAAIVAVALVWFIPDPRLERAMQDGALAE